MFHGGCWIFLTHYSEDIEKVRLVRNEFEKFGHNPLAFHLKCLRDDTESGKRELDSLIKREIDAREWFVFCENKFLHSDWVNMEKGYIEGQGKDFIWRINMNDDIDAILDNVRKICTDIEVFISYTSCDREKISPLVKELNDRDYSVWIASDNLKPGQNFVTEITRAISRCTYKGFFIIVISENSVKSKSVLKGLEFAESKGARIVLLILGEPEIPDDISFLITKYQQIHADPDKGDFTAVVNLLDSEIKKNIQSQSEV